MSAVTSYQVFLMKKEGSNWEKWFDIRDFPDLQGDPNMLDITTLSDGEEKQTPGIKRASEKKFKLLYDESTFAAIDAIEDEVDVAVWFGADSNGDPDGSNGKFSGKAIPSIKVLGKGVDEVIEMEVTLAMTSPFEHEE